jgi:glycosyltransferase involved in cell wall biosynthesis
MATPTFSDPRLEVLLPVHNEGASIESTIREIFDEIHPKVPMRFIVCEDGSRDNTKDVLRRLSDEIPMILLLSDARKGYSRAVVDGMAAASAPYLLCLDSDGQCDPRDFWPFWDLRDQAEVVTGWRVRRADPLFRRVMSGTFRQAYRAMYNVPVHDPSCPYLLIHRQVLRRIAPDMGEMQQGFWWEFIARVHRRGFSLRELPVCHRERKAGTTQVYKAGKLAGIGYHHFIALFRIWAQTQSGSVRPN